MSKNSKPKSFNRLLILGLLTVVGATSLTLVPGKADAATHPGFYQRQYYSSWSRHPTRSYCYCRYNYRPVVSRPIYHHHYVIYYPSRPRYRYYYNPVRRVYWGRYEVDENGNATGYSLLEPEDRKESLDQIDESAFPEPAAMPVVPESTDNTLMAPPTDLPADLELSK